MDTAEKKDYRKPGRGGFSQRRGFYGNARGYNSRSFGNHTWTFYENEDWERFQSWMKEEKERKKKEETKFLLQGVDDEKVREDRWREIQSEYKGKEGTQKLKEWCREKEVPYKNKDTALMAVMAAVEDR